MRHTHRRCHVGAKQINSNNVSSVVGTFLTSFILLPPYFLGKQRHGFGISKSAPPQYRSGHVNPKQTLGKYFYVKFYSR